MPRPHPLPPIPPLPARVRQAFRKKRLLNLHELTLAFGVSKRTVRRLAETGHLVCQSGELDPGHGFSRSDAAAFWKSIQRARYRAVPVPIGVLYSEDPAVYWKFIQRAIQRGEYYEEPPSPSSPDPLPRNVHKAFAKKPLLDIPELAAAFGYSERTMRRHAQLGHITYQIAGGGTHKPRRRFSRDDAVRFWNEQRRPKVASTKKQNPRE